MKRWALLLCLVALASGCGKNDGSGSGDGNLSALWRAQSIPDVQLRNLADLQRYYSKATLSPQPWAGYWWPYLGAGVANTWFDADGKSPADKYDAAYREGLRARGADVSHYQALADWERMRHGPGLMNLASWWGHCNGWSAAAVSIAEPSEPKVVNGVRFEIRDLKALAAESWMEFSGDFVGNRVDDPDDFSSGAFWDVVPAQFHLLLTNVMGRQNRGIIIDRYTGHEIWNQPVVAYEISPITKADYLGEHPDVPGIYRVNVTTRLWWDDDGVGADETTPAFDAARLHDAMDDHFFHGRVLRYELWLDAPAEFDDEGNLVRSGDILVTRAGPDGDLSHATYVGGAWKNGVNPAVLVHTHPDYMWMPYAVQHSTGYKNPRIDDTWIKENLVTTR